MQWPRVRQRLGVEVWRSRAGQSWRAVRSRRAELARGALLAAIFAVAIGLRLARVGYGLPYPVLWDEPLVMNTALKILATGNWQPADFTYGSFPIYLSVMASSAAFLRDSAHGVVSSLAEYTASSLVTPPNIAVAMTTSAPSAYLASRALLSLIGVSMVLLIYSMARWLGFRTSGLLGAAVVAVSAWHIYDTSVATVDGTAAFLVAAVICLSLLIAQGRANRVGYALAGMAAGLALATKISVAPVCAVIPVAYLVCPRQQRSLNQLVVALAAIPIAFLMAEPYALLSFSAFLAGLGKVAYHYSFQGHPGAEITPGWPAIGHYLFEVATALGWLGSGLALLGIGYCLVRRPREAAVVAAFPAAYLALVSTQIVYFPRNALPLLAPGALMLSVGSGVLARMAYAGVVRLSNHSASRLAWILARGAQAALALALLILIVWSPFRQQVATSLQMFQARDTREQAVAWLTGNVPAHTQIGVASQLPFHFPSLTQAGFSVANLDVSDPCSFASANVTVLLASQVISATSLRLVREWPGPPVTITALFSPRVLIYQNTETTPSPAKTVELADGCRHTLVPDTTDNRNQPDFAGAFYSAHGYYLMQYAGAATFSPLNAAAGHLALRLSAAGTQGGGRYPQLLAVLKRQAGDVELARRTIQLTGDRATYDLQFDLAAPGAVYLQLVFDDDFYALGQGDRNVLLYALDAQWSAP